MGKAQPKRLNRLCEIIVDVILRFDLKEKIFLDFIRLLLLLIFTLFHFGELFIHAQLYTFVNNNIL